MDILRQSTCLVVSLITVYSYGSPLLNCTTMGEALDATMDHLCITSGFLQLWLSVSQESREPFFVLSKLDVF